MIHQKQVRQLCAIHSVNNLLQLPSNLGDDSNHNGECDHVKKSDEGEEETGGGGCTTTTDEYQQNTEPIIVHDWTCRGKTIHSNNFIPSGRSNIPENNAGHSKKNLKRQWRAATQDEFDDIAKEFTLREQMLMAGDESTFLSTTASSEEVKKSSGGMISQQEGYNNIKNKNNKKLSMLQRFRSQYGTPYVGNYSLEVIEEALNRRGVQMEFYRVPNHEIQHAPPTDGSTTENNENTENTSKNESVGNRDANQKNDTTPASSSSETSNEKRHIGFIVHEKEEGQRSAFSFLSRIGSHIPIVKYFFGVGQHWYAITGVKHHRHRYLSSSLSGNNAPELNHSNNDGNSPSSSLWYLVDSKMNDMPAFQTNEELMEHVREVQQGGGLVFRAFVENRTDGNIITRRDEQ